MNAIAQAIYLARLQRGLSQQELADKAGIPQPNISDIEKGRDLKVSTLCQLAVALGTSPEGLLKGRVSLPVDKKRFFQRGNIERTVACIAQNKPLPEDLKEIARLIASVTGDKKGKKELHLAWATFRSTFSGDEIDSILSRIEKARKRSA